MKKDTLAPGFWNCKCNENYIHRHSKTKCEVCNSTKDQMPTSSMQEVLSWLYHERNLKTFKRSGNR